MWVDGSDVGSRDRAGHPMDDSSWLLVLHSGSGTELVLPDVGELELELDTGTPTGEPDGPVGFSGGDVVELPGCTFWLLRVL